MDDTSQAFLAWFKQHGKQSERISLAGFEGMGRGAVALESINPDTILFSIPRTLLLNTTNSKLSSLLTPEQWSNLKNWTPVILVMMWESRQRSSLWKEYFDVMPTQFDSLMFWSEEELTELKGSTIVEKIGKAQAIEDYRQLVQPLVQARPDVFGEAEYYSEDLYNRMGSLVLSRSFHVEEGAEEEDEKAAAETSGDAMNISADVTADAENSENGQDGEGLLDGENDEEDDEEDVTHVSMVPWADMLNARHGCDNARLFYEKDCLNMVSTKHINKGEQIWNVYGDPPNSDLLRRYGHVDAHNPSDAVEVTADLIADLVCKEGREERIEFLLEAEMDDTYVFTLEDHEEELDQMLCAIAVFHTNAGGFAKMQKRGKVSKKGLKDDMEILGKARDVFAKRLERYPHVYVDDERLLQEGPSTIPPRRRSAIVVRHGEMRILRSLIAELDAKLPKPSQDVEMADTSMERAPEKQRIMSKKEQREEKKRQREEEKLLGRVSDKKRRKA